jgi:hypothetical protein
MDPAKAHRRLQRVSQSIPMKKKQKEKKRKEKKHPLLCLSSSSVTDTIKYDPLVQSQECRASSSETTHHRASHRSARSIAGHAHAQR